MSGKAFKNILESILKKDGRLVDKNGELHLGRLREFVDKTDPQLIQLLLGDKNCREKFFLKIDDVVVFKQTDLKFFLDENQIDNSYTAYQNKIGLFSNDLRIKDSGDVVLNFPYKDCVLEGGQSTEDGTDEYYDYNDEAEEYEVKESPRKEIFFNEVIGQDEIDRLFEPKAFTNIKKYTSKGEEKFTAFKRNNKGEITDNLIIKGNNLLAMHSLEPQFKGQVKLIYIDPPYNTGSDSFKYNDNFNHSTWLVFMKNRLEIASRLLKPDGVILVQCDHHEMGYLNVLLDEVFGTENKIQQIAVKVAAASGFKAVNPGPIDVLENILFYAKNKKKVRFDKKNYVVTGYHKNYNFYLDNSGKDISKWKLISLKEKVLAENGYENEKEAKSKLGESYEIFLQQMTSSFAFKNAENVVSIRDLHKPTQQVKELQERSREERDRFFVYDKKDGDKTYLINGGALAFYSSKIKEIDGKMQVTELLTNFWNHISWAGIAKEGGVKLKNGKKPEKLIRQILELNTEEGDLVLDYHLGCGTTAAVAHKMNRRYIGIEQLDYGMNSGTVRLNNVIKGDNTGISKSVKWKGGGSFIHMELKKWNEEAKEKIVSCSSLDELKHFLKDLSEKYFLHYNVKFNEFKEKIIQEAAFIKLPLEKQKEMFSRMLDLNQLYVNAGEMTDKQYGLTREEIALTKNFYQL